MRTRVLILLGAIALLAGCQYDQYGESPMTDLSAGFEVELESILPDAGPETKTFADDQHLVVWHNDDRISVFEKKEYWEEYRYTGRTGTVGGRLKRLDNGDPATGGDIDYYYAIYPHSELDGFDTHGHMLLTIPKEQPYDEFSFGRGTNVMVSASEDNTFRFKNIGGYLVFKLYGEGISVSSIRLTGNNGEILTGDVDVVVSPGVDPVVTMSTVRDAAIYDEAILVCDPPVTLGATAEDFKEFWFVLPPVTLNGYSIEVTTSDGKVWTKSTNNAKTITRNHYSPISTMEVVIENLQQNSAIYYTSTDGNVVTPYNADAFGARILSNEYSNGQGIIEFDGDVTSIGDYAFNNCGTLSSFTIPGSVMSIGTGAFRVCDNLTSIFIPDSVTSIEENAFNNCRSMTSITIPESVTSIGDWAFANCSNLGSIVIPNSVTNISNSVFSGCSGLTSIVIPESVTSIEESAFLGCHSMTSITIPESVTSIGEAAFANCSSLRSIDIPDSITSIERFVFYGCSSISSIIIPDSVTSIGFEAFIECSSLLSIVIPYNVTSIDRFAFYGCSSLTSIVVNATTPPVGAASMFDLTNDCPIYVPSARVDAYKAASVWSVYSSRIQGDPSELPSDFNPNSFLIYRANRTVDYGSGDDYYQIESHFPGFSGTIVEMKFQLSGTGTIGSGTNRAKDNCNYFSLFTSGLNWGDDPYKEDGEWYLDILSFPVSNVSDLLLIRFDGLYRTMTVNGNVYNCPRSYMSFKYLFSWYGHEYDEGMWDVYSGVPDDSKLYYVKTWGSDGALNYVGYATRTVNPSTNVTECCWCSYYPKTDTSTYTFANDAVHQGGFSGYIYSN